ncbi:MAG: ORF6N domain-containing protein [Candidatus Woesearchaeota archaeon]|nr:ORF6N domain-containing protein [Candidatus Woesearchaeota archaeon]
MQVMLDNDLAELYGVETKRLNQQVKRNIERFPKEFMFQLTGPEAENLRSHSATSSFYGGRRYMPYAFTEQGVAMLSAVLKSKIAIEVSIQIMNAFIAMRKIISKNAEILSRLDSVEQKHFEFRLKTDKNFDKIFNALQSEKPKQGIYFNGEVFDAYTFVSGIIRGAEESIILLDNYIDDSVLTLFIKRKADVKATIFTKEISRQLSLDLERFNSQYPKIDIRELKECHDRFLIVDSKDVYHFGASLKDLGKKWFAFSRFDKDAFRLLDRLNRIS